MTATNFVFDGFGAVCDICGRPRRADELAMVDGIVICNSHQGYRRAQELDRLNARRRPFILRPGKNLRPLNPQPTYAAAESQIFDLIVSVSPFNTFDETSDGNPGIAGAKSYRSTVWALHYLVALVAEGKRPAAWRTRALAKAKELGDFLISVQAGNGTLPTLTATSDIRYGGFVPATGTTYLSGDSGVGCAAFCELYQQTGTAKYLDAAKRCANFIVNLQAGNVIAALPRPAVLYGPPTYSFDSSTNALDHFYFPQDLATSWGLSALKDIAGDGTYGAPGTAGGAFDSSPAKTLTAAIAQHRAFWATGAAPAGSATVINGFSAATPRAYFDGANATWNYDIANLVLMEGWSEGIYALLQVDGVTAQTTALWAYLMSLTSKASFETPSGYSDQRLLTGATGTFDPTIAPPTFFDAVANTNGSSFYDWAAAGLLAEIQATQAPAKLAVAKDILATPRPRTAEGTPRDSRTMYLGRMGRSGLSLQPYSSTNARLDRVIYAAQTGLIYRQRQVFGSPE